MLLVSGALMLVIALVLAAGGFAFRRHVLQALERITGAMGEVAKGNLAVEVPHAGRRDEIGMAQRELAQGGHPPAEFQVEDNFVLATLRGRR